MPNETWSEWIDRQAGYFFIMPAVVMILVFAIFPTIASIVIALSRIRPGADGYNIRFVGFQNFSKQFSATSRSIFSVASMR